MKNSGFDPHLSVERLASAKDSSYTVKEIEIDHLRTSIETPFKIISGKNINSATGQDFLSKVPNPIFETERFVSGFRSWQTLNHLLTESGADRVRGLDSFFNIRKSLWNNSLTTVSLIFPRNPFVENAFGFEEQVRKIPPIDETGYLCLLDYIHSSSSAFVLTPDIRIERNDNITIDGYLAFIDESIRILSDWNNKPIFAPLQLELSKNNIETILSHYKKQGYTNIWINFDAKSLHGNNSSRLRTIKHLVSRTFQDAEPVLYFSHIKKEITPNVLDERVPASDILTQFHGADFIGIDREPKKIFISRKDSDQDEATPEKIHMNSLHKHRVFDPESYYYYTIPTYPDQMALDSTMLLERDEINQIFNSVLLHSEIERTKEFVKEKLSIKGYIKNKEALVQNRLIDDIVPPSRQSDLVNILGGL